jgi:hypothetical protein
MESKQMEILVHRKPRVLSEEEVEHFVEKGYVIVRNAFSRNTAKKLEDIVWSLLPEDPIDRSTWNRNGAEIQRVIKSSVVGEMFTERYLGSVRDLIGGDWYTNWDTFGWIPVRFPGFMLEPWTPPIKGWHVDGMNFQHRLTSKELGLAGMEFYTDILKDGGGTALQVGSHKYVGRLLSEARAKGISYQKLFELSNEPNAFSVEQAFGQAGDVLWMHPFLIHARGPNVKDQVRIAGNRTISLKEDLCISKDNQDCSVLEWSISQMIKPKNLS